MKNNFLIKLLLLLNIMLLLNIHALVSDENTSNLQSVVLEDFELDENGKPKRYWIAVPDRFGKEGGVDSGKSLQQLGWINSWPEAYFGKEGVFDAGDGPKEYKTSLAAKVAFVRPGYNYVDLFPVSEQDGQYIRTPIPFMGRVIQVDLWIWGANYKYEMEMVVKDYRNVEHRLPIGSIAHVGWKNFTVTIPTYIPQAAPYIPKLKQLRLIKLVIYTTPKEKVTGAYVYIDHIKYLSDIFETKYDGYNLGDMEAADKLWESAPKAPDVTESNTTTE
jgi:hypothetical protein